MKSYSLLPGYSDKIIHRVSDNSELPAFTITILVAECGALCWPSTTCAEYPLSGYGPCYFCAKLATRNQQVAQSWAHWETLLTISKAVRLDE